MKKILILLIAIYTTGTTFAQSNHKCNDNKVTDCSGSVKDVTIKVGGSYTPSGIKAGESKCDQCGENVKKHKITYSSKRTDSPTRSSSFSFMSRSGSSGSGGVNIDTSKPGTYEVTATCSEGCSGLGSGTVTIKPKCKIVNEKEGSVTGSLTGVFEIVDGKGGNSLKVTNGTAECECGGSGAQSFDAVSSLAGKTVGGSNKVGVFKGEYSWTANCENGRKKTFGKTKYNFLNYSAEITGPATAVLGKDCKYTLKLQGGKAKLVPSIVVGEVQKDAWSATVKFMTEGQSTVTGYGIGTFGKTDYHFGDDLNVTVKSDLKISTTGPAIIELGDFGVFVNKTSGGYGFTKNSIKTPKGARGPSRVDLAIRHTPSSEGSFSVTGSVTDQANITKTDSANFTVAKGKWSIASKGATVRRSVLATLDVHPPAQYPKATVNSGSISISYATGVSTTIDLGVLSLGLPSYQNIQKTYSSGNIDFSVVDGKKIAKIPYYKTTRKYTFVKKVNGNPVAYANGVEHGLEPGQMYWE